MATARTVSELISLLRHFPDDAPLKIMVSFGESFFEGVLDESIQLYEMENPNPRYADLAVIVFPVVPSLAP
jgi:hypothetical protein